MKTDVVLFLVAAFGSAVLTPLLRRFCERNALLDASRHAAESRHRLLMKASADDDLWTIRLPISNEHCSLGCLNLCRPLRSEPLRFDVSYLTSAFQPAIAQAAQRIFDQAEQSMPRQRAGTAG